MVLWGDGSPKREFLHVDDLASAISSISNQIEHHLYNIGSNDEISISKLSFSSCSNDWLRGKVIWDKTFPNGTPRKTRLI